MKDGKLFKKNDIIVVIIVLLCAAAMFIPKLIKKDYLTAEIYIDGEIKYEIDLNNVTESYTINPDSNPSTEITVEKGRICFSSAECKDKLCVKSGWLDSNGQTAACLPAKVVINVKGSDKAPDMITY
jgi:hypothetical protein